MPMAHEYPPPTCTVTEAAMASLRACIAWEFLQERTPPEYVEIPLAPGKRLVYRLVERAGAEGYALIRYPEGHEGLLNWMPKDLMISAMKSFARGV